jgi:Na+/melibiose symporter-like transporter
MVPIVVDFLPKLVNAKQQNIYTGFAMVFLLFAVGATLFGFFNMRERVPLASCDQLKETSVLKSFLAIIRNRPLFALLLSEFFGNVKGIGGASESFFWLNNTGRLTNGTIAGLFTGLPNYLLSH